MWMVLHSRRRIVLDRRRCIVVRVAQRLYPDSTRRADTADVTPLLRELLTEQLARPRRTAADLDDAAAADDAEADDADATDADDMEETTASR